MDSEKRNGNPAEHNGNDNRHYHRPKRRRLRWGRLFLLLVVLAVTVKRMKANQSVPTP